MSPTTSGGNTSGSLNIKEFIPGMPWVGDNKTVAESDSWKAPGFGTSPGSSGLVRRGSLTMGSNRRMDGSSSSSATLSSSDWSLDLMAPSDNNLKNTMSVPNVWPPIDVHKDSDAGSSSSGFQTLSNKSYHSGASESSAKTS